MNFNKERIYFKVGKQLKVDVLHCKTQLDSCALQPTKVVNVTYKGFMNYITNMLKGKFFKF